MVKINAVPLKGAANIKFGMRREKVREILGEAVEFKKSPFSKTTTDDFGYCHVFYDANDECEAIEIFDGSEVVVNDTVIFPSDIEHAKKILGELLLEYGSYINKYNSVGIYAPYGKMESILFGRPGYYES